MTQDIIEMAKQAGFVVTYVGDPIGTNCAMIEAFAKLMTAKERERLAKVFDARNTGTGFYEPHEPAQIIRGEA